MQNGIFKLDLGSVVKAVVTAVVFAVLTAAVTIVGQGNFDLFTADWIAIGHNMANIGFIAAVVSLGQELLSTNKGSVLGITPETSVA